jgi:hypothetical protein
MQKYKMLMSEIQISCAHVVQYLFFFRCDAKLRHFFFFDEEQKLQEFENTVLRKIPESKKEH